MRVWLAGSRSFGVAVFRALQSIPTCEVVAITAPEGDPLRGGSSLLVPAFSEVIPNWVSSLRADVIVSAQNYKHVDADAREAATYGAIGYHPSLLPRHRGRSAVEWTIAMGDPIAGGTVYQMDDGWDTGPIIAQDWCHVVPDWSASDLWREQLFSMGVRLLREVIADSALRWRWPDASALRPQDPRVATTEGRWEDAAAQLELHDKQRREGDRFWRGVRERRDVRL